jgi:lysophospholipase L1-like esterase
MRKQSRTMQSKIELKPNQTIVFIGDSITDADRSLPVYGPFGFGYVHFVANLLIARYPRLDLRIVNTGVSGNTIREMKDRWAAGCIAHKPDVLSVLIGINDLWSQHAGVEYLDYAVSPEEYEFTYRMLLSQAKQQLDCRFVLMEPFMFCSDSRNPMLKGLHAYNEVVHNLADEFDAVLVPLQSRIDEEIVHVPPEKWSADSVHPYLWAHAWIAQCWLDATGL